MCNSHQQGSKSISLLHFSLHCHVRAFNVMQHALETGSSGTVETGSGWRKQPHISVLHHTVPGNSPNHGFHALLMPSLLWLPSDYYTPLHLRECYYTTTHATTTFRLHSSVHVRQKWLRVKYLLNIFTADCLRHPIQMAGVETIWELHTLSVIYCW